MYEDLILYVSAPHSMRATSFKYTTAPLSAVATTIFSKSLTLLSNPFAVNDNTILFSLTLGEAPILPIEA